MRRFAALLDALSFQPARNAKLRLIEDYLRSTPDPDRGYALAALTGSPIVELNRAVAISMAYGPEEGLEIVDALVDDGRLDSYHLLPAVRADLLAKLGRWEEARAELVQHVKPQLMTRYSRVSQSLERTVVPVVGELCTGCFAKIPTSFRYEKNAVMTCENCGRILYFT